MADVIYDALRPHQYPTAPTPALIGCSGCAWTHPCARPDGPFTAHLAEVVRAAVLEVVDQGLDEWLGEPQASRATKAIAAALAGEG